MNDLSERILCEWWYRVCMFPAWIVEEHPRKIVRFLGLLFAFPWFMAFLPFTFIVTICVIPLMIWEDI